jgi:hypothetical protein
MMSLSGRLLLETAAGLITAGGLFDVFVSRLPKNLAALCGEDERAVRLVRELLRALGGALVAIGLAVFALAATSGVETEMISLIVILVLVVPAEGLNAFCMYRVGSPFYIPLAFILLTLLGVTLAWPRPTP